MNAYNYDSQQWESGESAVITRAAQIKDELAILESPRAMEYCRFLGQINPRPEILIKALRAELGELLNAQHPMIEPELTPEQRVRLQRKVREVFNKPLQGGAL